MQGGNSLIWFYTQHEAMSVSMEVKMQNANIADRLRLKIDNLISSSFLKISEVGGEVLGML